MSHVDDYTVPPYPSVSLGEALIQGYELYFELRSSNKILARIDASVCAKKKHSSNTMEVEIPPITFISACLIQSLWLVAYGCGSWWQIHDALSRNNTPFHMNANEKFSVEKFTITMN